MPGCVSQGVDESLCQVDPPVQHPLNQLAGGVEGQRVERHTGRGQHLSYRATGREVEGSSKKCGMPPSLVVVCTLLTSRQAAHPPVRPEPAPSPPAPPTADECRRQHIRLCPHVCLPLNHIKQPVPPLLVQRLGVGKPPTAVPGRMGMNWTHLLSRAGEEPPVPSSQVCTSERLQRRTLLK